MFDQLKAMGAVAGLMKNKDKLAQIADRVRADLESVRVDGSAGGGTVTVSMSGKMSVLDVRIAPALATSADVATMEQMVKDAVTDAQTKAQDAAKRIIQRAADELGLGDISGIAQLAGGF